MPYIECHIATGLTKARKTQLIRDIVPADGIELSSDAQCERHRWGCVTTGSAARLSEEC